MSPGLFDKADRWLATRSFHLRLPKLDLKKDMVSTRRLLRRLLVAALVLLVLFGFSWTLYWLTHVGPGSEMSNSDRQVSVPTVSPPPREGHVQSIDSLWSQLEILDQEESKALRQRSDVVNLALLDSGSASYATVSVQFSQDRWIEGIPFGLTQLSVRGTTVVFLRDSCEYWLNVYQPFTFEGSDNVVFLVDLSGQIWEANISDLLLIPVDQVKTEVPVAANNFLTLSFRR